MRQSRAMPKISAPPESVWSFKGHRQNLWHRNCTTSLQDQYCCLHQGPLPQLFHIPPSTHGFWQKKKKKPSISEQYELLISQPQFLLSPRLSLSSFFSTFLVPNATPFPLSGVFSVGVVLTCELDHLRQFKSLTSGFSLLYFNWFGSRSFLSKFSSIGIMNHQNDAFYCSASNTRQIFKSNKGAFFLIQMKIAAM